jgi:DNA-binding CsgD family transcriptional regulator
MKIAIIADPDFETVFDEVKGNAHYKNAQLDEYSCAFLSSNNSFSNNLIIIKTLGITKVFEITMDDSNNEYEVEKNGLNYIGVSIKGDFKSEYIRALIKAVLNDKDTFERNVLSAREKEILLLVGEGLQNKEIARKLFLSEKTVKNHISNIFKKINIHDRTKAALFAVKNLK